MSVMEKAILAKIEYSSGLYNIRRRGIDSNTVSQFILIPEERKEWIP